MWLSKDHQRFFMTGKEQPLPLFIESIGENNNQEPIERPAGYPCYHWLQTVDGEGAFSFEGRTYPLPKGTGILLAPNVPHHYSGRGEGWSTIYITFSGPQAAAILSSLDLQESAYYQWKVSSELQTHGKRVLDSIGSDFDLTGLDASGDIYRFLLLLKKHGTTGNTLSLSHAMDRLAPLLSFMEEKISDPGVGLMEMAEVLSVSPRYLNMMFKQSFGITAYSYFILKRIRKSKEIMTSEPHLTVKETAGRVGFRDASHFVATFRRIEGITPEHFRTLY
ncbi:AraC family transcriptional regulator [Paenibacillus shunpengii]|uniref:AraC family transcriptional regulator n=1 Tax=Paenibacillus shunpengii TaxID=2054424 RepID=A0ABW5SLG9_9BACL|nr:MULTISPECIES: AraC family transcriptional regulator [unclassified Paenibacillus]OMC71140.1 AraC family transcriptional regulator [Paenibacillus sp. FSL H7-0326]SDW17857.1 AraC-like ligand binding domain-containing protein [Paenibacillus sp. PDC88]